MTEWFARAVLHVADVEGSLRFYVEAILDGTDESVPFPTAGHWPDCEWSMKSLRPKP